MCVGCTDGAARRFAHCGPPGLSVLRRVGSGISTRQSCGNRWWWSSTVTHSQQVVLRRNRRSAHQVVGEVASHRGQRASR